MGRKKSIDRRIAGKSLADVRRELRQIEQSIINESILEAGEMAIGIYKDQPDHPVFEEFQEFGKKLAELAEVVGPGKRGQPERLRSGIEQSKPSEKLRAQSEKLDREKPENKPGRFVKDVPDNEI